MEKKRNVGKLITVAALALIAVLATCLIFAGCATNIRTIDQNGEFNIGNERVVVNVPSGDTTNYDVEFKTADTDYSGETLVETVERIRPTVVDVYASTMNNAYAGSGVILGGVNKNGDGEAATTAETADTYDQYYIVTNHHVIDDCTSFSVNLLFIADDGTETHDTYTATLVGGSPGRDIAVLRIDRKADEKIVLAELTDSDKVKVGTEVLAIGNPLGILGGTVTKGIVSATAREVEVGDIGTMTLMQTDTAINGGNSGGGLFNTSGRLVGIVNSGYDTDNTGASVEGLNFAIPANDAKFAASSLIETYTETDGVVTKYGYVKGDTNLDITITTKTLYESASSTVLGTYIVAATNSSSSPLYSKWQNYYKALISFKVNDVSVDISSLENAKKAVAAITDGSKVTIEYKDVMVTGFNSFNKKYYLGSETSSVTVTAEQYVYSI